MLNLDAQYLRAGSYSNTVHIIHDGADMLSPIGIPVSAQVNPLFVNVSKISYIGIPYTPVITSPVYKIYDFNAGSAFKGTQGGVKYQVKF